MMFLWVVEGLRPSTLLRNLRFRGWHFVGHLWVAGASFWFQCALHVDTDPINLALPVLACRDCSNVSTLASHGLFSCPLSAETDSISRLANAGER